MFSSMKRLLIIVGVIMSMMIPRWAFADSQTFNSIFFTPATGKNRYLLLHGSETLHQLQFDVGGYFSYGYQPLDLRQDGSRVQGVIDHLLVYDFVAAIGILEQLQFGLDVPLVLINQFRSPMDPIGAPAANQFDLSDIRFEAKVRVLDACQTHVGLAFVPFLTLPTGKDAHYVGDPGMTGGLRIALDGRINPYVAMTFNVGYQGGRKVHINNVEFQHRLLIGGGVQGNLSHGVDLFGEINAIAAFNKLFHDRDMNPTEAMVGARWDVKESGVTLQAGAGTCLVCGVKGARARAVVGAKYRYNPQKFRTLDKEAGKYCFTGLTREQIYTLKENCPRDPDDWQAGVHDEECPKFYELQELAGLVLKCPSNPEDFDARYDDPACPKVFDLSTLYGPDELRSIVSLAVSDMSLMCPEDPARFNPQIHDVSCPKYYDLEETGTLAERCPSDPADYHSGVDDPSCPKYYTLRDEYGDVDWDEVQKLQAIDRERYGRGIRGGEIQTLRRVFFEFGSSELTEDARIRINHVIGVINKTPYVSTVRVGGHADAVGTEQANQEISYKRAETVIHYMRTHGVRSDVKLVPIAYGENRPIAPNDTESGRQLNRRVVFTISTYEAPMPARPAGSSPSRSPVPAEAKGESPGTPPPARWR